MRSKILIIIALALFFHAEIVSGQCIEKDILKKQLDYLRKVSTIPDGRKLKILLDFADQIKFCSYKYDSTHCSLLIAIGELYYKDADYLNAIQYYKQAIGFISITTDNPAVLPGNLVGYYYNLSEAYDALNNVNERLTCLDSAITIGIRLQSVNRICLWSMYCRVLYYYDVGEYRRCIEFANMCERFGKEYAAGPFEKSLPGGLDYAAASLQMSVMALMALAKYDDAEILLSGRIDEYKSTPIKIYLGTLYEQLAEVLAHKRNYKQALFYFREAYNQERLKGNSIMCKTILNNLGYNIYFLNDRNPDSALFYYHKALETKINDISLGKLYSPESFKELNALESLNVLNSMADVFVRKGLFDSAYKYIQLAFDQVRSGINEQKIMKWSQEELSKQWKIRYLTNLFISKGTAYHQSYKATGNTSALHEAIRIYKLTDQLLDRIKAGQFDTESKLFWRSDSRHLYEQAIQASFSNNNIQDAFYFFEKSRAVVLNDQLNEQHWVGEKDIVKQTQLRSRINFLEKEINKTDNNRERLKELQDNLFSNRQELDALSRAIKIKNPLYYQNFIDSAKITLEIVQKQILKDHEAFIEIFTGDSAIYELILTKERNYFKAINKANFDQLSELYVGYISDPVAGNIHFNDFAGASQKLYHLLFTDINIPGGRIIISPDGHYFPFESLVTSFKNGTIRYFLNDYAVSYTYSARYLLNDFGNDEGDRSKKFIGFAPVKFNNNNLVDLPGSDISLKILESYFNGSEGLVKEKASKNNFLEKFYSYKIIQLYTHAADSGYNGEPIIWFADSVLSLSDLIYEHKPVTKLIVLSACETAKGKLYKGEGIFSFNRGFAALGIPSSVSSLWAVDDQSSYRITELFYKYLQKGMPTDIALQKAKLDFISTEDKEKQMPYYWAASIFVGINESFEPEKRSIGRLAFLIAAIAAIIGVMFLIIYRTYSRKKKSTLNV